MQSSFNVIKNSRVIKQGSREINTQLSEVTVQKYMEMKTMELKMMIWKAMKILLSNILENARRAK